MGSWASSPQSLPVAARAMCRSCESPCAGAPASRTRDPAPGLVERLAVAHRLGGMERGEAVVFTGGGEVLFVLTDDLDEHAPRCALWPSPSRSSMRAAASSDPT